MSDSLAVDRNLIEDRRTFDRLQGGLQLVLTATPGHCGFVQILDIPSGSLVSVRLKLLYEPRRGYLLAPHSIMAA